MTERLLGMETEYGLSVLQPSGARGSTERAAEDLVQLAARLPHLPAMRSSGLFMANGSRFYVDCGTHPELATPECTNPWDVCRYAQAGDRMLLELAARLVEKDRGIARTMLLKSNVDYQARSTWGSHESYLHRGLRQDMLARQITPHLVSRIVYSGAGGFDCFSPGIDFLLSPRVAFLHTAISGDSTSDHRGIFHTREEPLSSRGYGRLHLLCGESLCGQTGAWLKVATTALVVALIDAGKRPGEAVAFRDPLAAMRTFAADPSCSRTVPLGTGREAGALEVQRHFLAQVETHAGESFMPPWAGEVCRHWRAMLDRLEHGAGAVARTLDWAIKLALFQNHARRRHTTLETLARWTPVLTRLHSAYAETARGAQPLTAALVLGPKSPLASLRKELTPVLRERELAWDDLEAVLALRLELFEIDTRYGLLGDGGLFTALDRDGILEHRFPGVDNIVHAQEHPPATGRAAIRGACIRRVAGQNGRFAAEWDGVWDLQGGHQLDLADPFCSAEHWKPHRTAQRFPDHPDQLFRDGRYADLLDQVAAGASVNEDDIVLSLARLGRREEALATLRSIRTDEADFRRRSLHIWIHCTGLVPDVEALPPLIAEGDRVIDTAPAAEDDYSSFVFHCCKAQLFLHTGRAALAEPLLRSLLENPAHAIRSRMFARAQCFLAELCRRDGRRSEALDLLQTATHTHRTERLLGDSATHSLPMQAKLTTDDAEAAEFLKRAEDTHRLQRNDLGLAQVLSLRARRLRTPRDRPTLERLLRSVPVLTHCKLARRILGEWDSWIAPPPTDAPVDYWGL